MLKASQLHHGAFLDGAAFASLCVQEFDGIEKCRNIPASGDRFNLSLFSRELYKVLDGTCVVSETERWFDALHPLSEPKKRRYPLDHLVYSGLLQWASFALNVDVQSVESF